MAIRRFWDWLVHYPWVDVLTVLDVTEKRNNYLATVTQAYLHFFPTKIICIHPKDLPWIIPRIKNTMKQRIYGVGGQLLKGIQTFYREANACVRVGGKFSESFAVEVGVRQGCVHERNEM